MLGTTKLKEVWLVPTKVEPCLISLVAEEVWLTPREAELLTDLTELLDLTEALELLTAGLLELFGVGIEMGNKVGSLTGLLDLEETLALLVELGLFDKEDELSFLLLEGATGALLEDDEEDFLLEEEEDFEDADEVFLLEATGLTVTVGFLMLIADEEAVLGKLVNFRILESVSCLVGTGSMIVETFFELELGTLALLELFFELLLDNLTLLEGFPIEETLGMERVMIGLIEEALAVEEDNFLVEIACPEW